MTPAMKSLVLPTLTNAFCEETVREEARSEGVVQRQGKVDAYHLLVVVVLGLVMRGPAAIAQLGQTFGELTGTRLARSSFWYRFKPGFARLVEGVLSRVVSDAREVSVKPPGVLSVFKDVLAADATVMKVPDSLRPVWKGTRRNSARAALKVHAWIRVFTGELVKYSVTPEAYADSRAFGIDQQLRGVLMLFDRGYSAPSLWRLIDSVGGYFLSRIPAQWNQTIVSENRKHRGRARCLVGQSLQGAFTTLNRSVVDVNAEFRCKVRKYGELAERYEQKEFRVVALRHPQTNEFGLFVTNAPPEMLAVEDIYQVYRLRWEVETFFKTLKSGCAADEFPSSKQHIVETLLYAGLLRAALAMRAKAKQGWILIRRVNNGQWMRWWNRQLPTALIELAGFMDSRCSINEVLIMLSDPNQGRIPTRFSLEAVPQLA